MLKATDFRAMARDNLKTNWGVSIGVCLIAMILIGVSSMLPILGLFIAGPMTLGLALYFIRLNRTKKAGINDLFEGFSSTVKAFLGMLLYTIWIALWSLLFIIPGIIKAFSYAMYPYIMADNKDMSAIDCITESRRIMDGNKWRLFCLNFSFIGWAILASLTFGIGYLWLIPYIQASNANFYESIKNKPAVSN